MSLILGDRIRQTSTTTGSGTLTLDGSVAGFQSFSVIGDGNTTYYTIALDSQWEVGIGTYSAGTLSRDTVLSSSTGSKIVFAVGAKDVFVSYPAEKSVNQDANNRVLIPYTSGVTNVGSLNVGNATGHTDSGVIAGFTASEPLYLYTSLQNTSTANTSYASYAVNDGGHTAYAELGINNSTYSYTAAGFPNNGFSTPLASFVESYGGPLVIGSWDNQKISFITNGAVNTTDAITINTNGSIAFNGQVGTAGQVLQSNATSAPTWVNAGTGTVTSVSVASANGFAGSVANATTTPAITVSTSITGVLKGNGTAISAASAGTDYQAPITLTTTGTSGAATFVGNTLNIPQYSGGGGSGTVTSVDATVPAFLSVTGGPITTTGTLAISYSGTALPIANGGTGATTQQAAINALAGSVQNSRFLAGDGVNVTMRSIAVVDVPTLNQNTTGTAANVTGTVAIANGGTGQITAGAAFNALSPITTTGDLIIGNGTNSAIRLPIGANTYVLTSNGTTASWAAGGGGGGSVTISNDTTTATNLYPAFFSATSGTASTVYTSNAKLLYKPSTGELQSSILTGEVNAPNTFGFKNRIINGAMVIDQRNAGASQTFTAAAALAYAVDRWYGYCTGANVTGQQIAGGTTPTVTQNRYRFTGAASVTAVGFGQRIEQKNSYDLAGSTCTLSADLAISATLTTVTWTAYYATTTADTFGSLASPTVTQIATGTFTVSATVTNFSTNISVPAAATTGIQIVFTVGALTAGLTWTIGNVQLEKGSTATSFDYRPYGTELLLCQRYYYRQTALGVNSPFYTGQTYIPTQQNYLTQFPVQMRAAPSLNTSAAANFSVLTYSTTGTITTLTAVPTLATSTIYGAFVYTTQSLSGAGGALLVAANSSAYVEWTGAEL
jgi:hypothetical protein